MGRRERDKGKRGELMLRDVLRSAGWPGAERGQQRHGGAESPDVRGGPAGVHFECKFVEALPVRKAHRQAASEAPAGALAAVAWKTSREPWLAIVDLGAFLALVRELETRRLLD